MRAFADDVADPPRELCEALERYAAKRFPGWKASNGWFHLFMLGGLFKGIAAADLDEIDRFEEVRDGR